MAPPAQSAEPPPPAEPDRRAFDGWLRAELVRLHAEVLTEPVPDRLLKILQGRPGG